MANNKERIISSCWEEEEKRNGKEKYSYPPSLRDFLDDLTKKIYDMKEKEKLEKSSLLPVLVKNSKELMMSLENYWKRYQSLEQGMREAQEEKMVAGGRLESTEIQAINQGLQMLDSSREAAHFELIKKYYEFVHSYKQCFKQKFPWLNDNIFDEKGEIRSRFLNNERKIDADEIAKEEREEIGDWAIKMMQEKTDEKKQEDIDPYLDLLNNEWKKQVEQNKNDQEESK